MTNATNQPIKKEDRIDFLDVLRGIAILFIFSANIVYFSGYFMFPPEAHFPATNFIIDPYFDFTMYTLVDGKFYSIFSLLFGIGCYLQFDKLKNTPQAFTSFFRRRMFWLLVFGLIHLCFIWIGDILTLYATLGFLLIWFVNFKNKQLIIIACILLLMPILNWFIINAIGFDYASTVEAKATEIYQYFGMPITEYNGRKSLDYKAYLLNENLLDYFKMNLGNVFLRIGGLLEEGRLFKVFGIFLIGLVAGRSILYENLLNNKLLLKKMALIGIGVGLPVCAFRGYIEFYSTHDDFWNLLKTITYAFGTVPLALGYAALIALIYKKSNLFNWFIPIGKMAFTNYISQSLIAITFFYGIGFGLVGKFGFTVIMLITICIFTCQVIFSTLWLKKHQFGPLEWVWRQLTYGNFLK